MERLENQIFGALLAGVAAKSPTPGGGAVAAMTGATAAALAAMVVAYSLGKKNLAPHQPQLERAAEALARARGIFLELAEEDAAAYALLNDLTRLPPGDPRREREMAGAVLAAMSPPRATAAGAADLLRLIESLVSITNRHLRSDLVIAAVLAEACAKSAWWNVLANLPSVGDQAERAKVREEGPALLAEASRRREAVERGCAFTEPE